MSDPDLARESLYATLLKAAGDDDNALASNVHAHEEEFAQNLDGLPCPYPPEPLVRLYERSSALRPCVEAMVTNVHAFRHRLVPRIDLEAADADQRISDCILAARLDNGEEDPPDPTEQEIATKRAEIARGIKIEAIRLNSFFRNCSSIGWTQVRKRIATDLEVTGNGYLEVVRDAGGRISKLNHCPAVNMRLRALEAKPIKMWRRRWVGEVDLELEEVNEKPRGFVQRVNMDRTFFKAFGDPRVIGASNGAVYDSPEAMPKGEREATEIVHFGVFAGRTSYGVPRWIGAVFEVLGIEAYSQVNYLGFDNKGIPPLAVTVSGGTLGPGAAEYLENYMKVRMKGRMNYHSVLLLEAVATNQEGGTGGRGVQVGIQPLTQPQDAVYLEYANRSEDIVARQWRISPITRGKVDSTFNRACYSADTETLTENGWKLHMEIAPDERIAAYDPQSGTLKFVVPAAKHVYDVEEELVRFENQHTDCLVTADHTVIVQSAQAKAEAPPWEVFEAGKVPYNRFRVKLAADRWEGKERRWFWLPQVEKCKRPTGHAHGTKIRMDDWLEFLGYFISEGGLLLTKHPTAPYVVYVDQTKPRVKAKMRACLDRLGWKYSTQDHPCGSTHFLFSNRCLREWLLENVGTHAQDKKIPWGYLNLSKRQLKILFRAMMDGDGSVDGRENRSSGCYYTSSTVLAGQVQRLLIQLGKRATIIPGTRAWRVMFCDSATTRLSARPGRRTRMSVTRVTYKGEVYCFSVPGFGFFVTRRNGKVAIQGNTADAALKKDEEQVFQPARAEFDEQLELTVLLDLGVRYHRVESNSPVASDPDSLSVILERLVKNNVLTPNEARKVASNILNTDLHEIAADWAKQPAAFTLNGIPLQEDADDPVRSKMADAATTIQRVLDLRAKVHQETMAQSAMAEAKARADEAGVVDEHEEIIDGRPVTVVRMLPEAFAKIARPHGAANDAAEDQDDAAAA